MFSLLIHQGLCCSGYCSGSTTLLRSVQKQKQINRIISGITALPPPCPPCQGKVRNRSQVQASSSLSSPRNTLTPCRRPEGSLLSHPWMPYVHYSCFHLLNYCEDALRIYETHLIHFMLWLYDSQFIQTGFMSHIQWTKLFLKWNVISPFCLSFDKKGGFLSTGISCNHEEEFKASSAQMSEDVLPRKI